MKYEMNYSFGAIALVAALTASSASAQNLTGRDTVAGDRNDDLIEAIEDDADRELDRFGNEGRPQGFTGSIAARGEFNSGNTDNATVGIGTDLNFVQGVNGYQLLLNYNHGASDGVTDEESLFYGLEYTRDFSSSLFGFAKLQGSLDEFSSFESDTFASFGAGYRIINETDVQWSVQAGPGYRFAEFRDATSGDVSEAAFGIGSDYSNQLTRTTTVTNDTDVVTSESDTVIYNDLAVSVSVTDTLALRTSLLTEYHTDPQPGFEDTDNSIGVSMVYNLN